MESRTCRLCKADIAANRAISLFSPRSVQQNLSTRFTQLLGLNIHANDGLPPHICKRCRRQLERLEGAMQDLENFRNLAKESYNALLSRGSLKRTKGSSGAIGVSPDTAMARDASCILELRRWAIQVLQGICHRLLETPY